MPRLGKGIDFRGIWITSNHTQRYRIESYEDSRLKKTPTGKLSSLPELEPESDFAKLILKL